MNNKPENRPPTIAIIGKGNVGSHLHFALSEAGISCQLCSSRDLSSAPKDCAIYLICVKDFAIADVAQSLRNHLFADDSSSRAGIIVAHTSGSVTISVLKNEFHGLCHTGVFYPMQTFTKGVDMTYSEIPFLIEGDHEFTLEKLMILARVLSPNVIEADSQVRADYHIGSVLTCNFTNHLCTLADEYLAYRNLDFRLLLPLLRQTLAKLEHIPPFEAQTGPAMRGDRDILISHLRRINGSPGDPPLQKIYTILSGSIGEAHGILDDLLPLEL